MPGHDDGWSLVQFSTRLSRPFTRAHRAPASTEAAHTDQATTPKGGRPGRRLALPAIATASALVVVGGTAAFADAHKSVTLDVDGHVRDVTTFAGSVDGLLADEGIRVGAHDDVTTGALVEGATVVVRHAHQLTVASDSGERRVWSTALSADDALELLAARDDSVALVASRSSSGRAQLALDLTLDGAARVQVDGTTFDVEDGDVSLAAALDALGITLGDADRVSVTHDEDGELLVVVQRVVVAEQTRTVAVPFATTTTKDADAYKGVKKVTTKGVAGVQTIVERVTTVDGVETARVILSDDVTTAPVAQVVAVGTKARPAATRAKAGKITAGGSADSLNWAALAKCESGGRVNAVSASGKYHGLYQFSVGTWKGVGGAGLPSQASAAEQTARAKMLYNRSGAGQWPTCGKKLFS